MMDEYVTNPAGIPPTIRVHESGFLDFWDLYVHVWVSAVTWGRNHYLVNLLLILFSNRGAALEYIWNTIIEPAGRHYSNNNLYVPWMFSTPPNVGFRCKYKDTSIGTLTAYLEFLYDVGGCPLDHPRYVRLLCDWADSVLANQSRNQFATAMISPQRLEAVRTAHEGQPWVREDGNYPACPRLDFWPLTGDLGAN